MSLIKRLTGYGSWVSLASPIVAGLFFILILVNRTPPYLFRQPSVLARYSFSLLFPLLLLSAWAVFRVERHWGVMLAFCLGLGMAALCLNGLWASGRSEPAIVSGLLPWQDANAYYLDARRLLDGQGMFEKSASRPLSPVFLAVLLGLSHSNLMAALAICAALVGLALACSSLTIKSLYGPLTAAIYFSLLYLYQRHWSGSTLTENLALILACSGLGLILAGVQKEQPRPLLAGLLFLSLALNARPGPFFVLPALVLWLGLRRGLKRFDWKLFLLGLAAVTLGFGVNALVTRLVAAQETLPFSNFAYALYGLAANGSGYEKIFIDHPEVRALAGPEHYLAVYRLTLEHILAYPGALFEGIASYYRYFFLDLWFGIWSFLTTEDGLPKQISAFILYLGCAAALGYCWKKRRQPFNALLLVLAGGILLSVPFVPVRDSSRMRLYAAVMPLIALLPGVGLSALATNIKRLGKWVIPAENQAHFNLANLSLGGGISLMILVGLGCIRLWASPQTYQTVTCPAGQEALYFQYTPGSSVTIHEESKLFLDWLPDFHRGRYQINIHGLPNQDEIDEFESIEAPASILNVYELENKGYAWVVIDPQQLPTAPGLVRVCGQHGQSPAARQYNIFYAAEIK